MTVIIGMKGSDYAILASDCFGREAEKLEKDPVLFNKIEYAGDTSTPYRNGIYVAMTGTLNPWQDRGTISFFKRIEMNPELVDLLDDPSVTNTSLADFDLQVSSIPLNFASYEHFKETTEKRGGIYPLMSLRELIEQTQGKRLTNVTVRYSEKKGIDLLLVCDGIVSSASCIVAGSGTDIVGEYVTQNYQDTMHAEEAFSLAIDAMNKVLKHEDAYQGYSLVFIQKESDGVRIHTAASLNARSIDKETIPLTETHNF